MTEVTFLSFWIIQLLSLLYTSCQENYFSGGVFFRILHFLEYFAQLYLETVGSDVRVYR